MMIRLIGFCSFILLSSAQYVHASNIGMDCNNLPKYSNTQPQINQHHVFCGEVKKKSRAVGFHARINDISPSTVVSYGSKSSPDEYGIYTMKNIMIKFGDLQGKKSMSSIYPAACSQDQIIASILHSINDKNARSCSSVSWAKCGLSGPQEPSDADSKTYCLGDNNQPFFIASAIDNAGKINTAFPIQGGES